MTSVVKCINRRYSNTGEGDQCGFLFMSCSPESKRGLLPNIISLNNYNIEVMGEREGSDSLDIRHITSLDLTDNLLSDWNEVFNILKEFTNLEFLNLTNNLLTHSGVTSVQHAARQKVSQLRKLVLNGNKLRWESVHFLMGVLPQLEELHISTNNLQDISDDKFSHNNLRILYLSCNPLSDLKKLQDQFILNCPNLECLTLAECPINKIPRLERPELNTLKALNLSCSQISSWQQLDNITSYEGLSELKIQEIPLLMNHTAHERRMMVVSRLPNIKILNGGDKISTAEREDSERTFIRHYLYSENGDERPPRLDDLIEVHGLLEPLANVDLTPEIHVSVTIKFKDDEKEQQISVRQTVKSFKKHIEQLYNISSCSMRVFYYDQEMSKLTGPEEMKYNSKGLYTYNIRDGDYFEVDIKPKQRKPSGSITASPKKKSTDVSMREK